MHSRLAAVSLAGLFVAFVACSSTENAPIEREDDGSSSSSSSGGSSSSSSGASGSSSSGSPSDAGPDASACSAPQSERAGDLLAEARSKAVSFLADACAEDITQYEIAELVQQAIDECGDARTFYAELVEAEPLREALAGSVTAGMLAGKPFAEALVGASIHSISPGVGPAPFTLTFGANGSVTSNECILADDFVCTDAQGSYTLEEVDGTLTLTLDFLNAPQTPGRFTVAQDADISVPVFVFEADDPSQNAYTFPELCSA